RPPRDRLAEGRAAALDRTCFIFPADAVRVRPMIAKRRGPRAASIGFASLLAVGCASSKPGGAGDDGGEGALVDAGGARAPDAAGPPADASPVPAIYVATTGSDGNPGTAAQPPRRLAPASERPAACAPAPCEVRLAEGPY